MCGLYCVVLIEYTIAGKTLLDYTNLFFHDDYKNNGNIIYKYLQDKYDKSKRNLNFRLKRYMKQEMIFSKE